MAKKRGGNKNRGASIPTFGPQDSSTPSKEITGKIKPKISNNVKSYLNHLENLATWASGQASIPSLAAFFGHRLAAAAESSAVAPNASLFLCRRCETILQPGSNCSIRIEKNNAKRRRRHDKRSKLTQNNVAYYCHHCSFRNIKRGTYKGHMKVLYDTEFKSKVKLVDVKNDKECETSAGKMATKIVTPSSPEILLPTTGDILTIDAPAILSSAQSQRLTGKVPIVDAPATPPTTTGMTLLDSNKRKRKKPLSKNQTKPEASSAPTADGDTADGTSKRKRKRKSWTSLKEIAQRNEQSGKQNVAELAIPFSLTKYINCSVGESH